MTHSSSSLSLELSSMDGSTQNSVHVLNSVGKDKTKLYSIYTSLLLIHSWWYEFPSGTYCSEDLSHASNRGENHDGRDTMRLYKYTLRGDKIGHGDSDSIKSKQTKHGISRG